MSIFRLFRRLFRRRSAPSRLSPHILVRSSVEATVIVTDTQALPAAQAAIVGPCWVIDGDTIVIDKVRLRIAGIVAQSVTIHGDNAPNETCSSCAGARRLQLSSAPSSRMTV